MEANYEASARHGLEHQLTLLMVDTYIDEQWVTC